MRQISGKYKIDGTLTKNDGTPLPDNEPMIMFRGQDKLLPELLEHYNELCTKAGSPQTQIEAINQRIESIKRWQAANPDRVKVPD